MVTPNNIDEMARLIAIMNGGGPVDRATSVAAGESVTDPNVAAMKAILERFSRGSEQAAERLVAESADDGSLREAMALQQTEHGAALGMWQINAKVESGRKLYDVIRLDETAPIASDLTIYEAARGLARALHEGLSITSKPVRNLLRFEEVFANAAHDAIHARYALRNHALSDRKRALLEDKYGAAVRRAQDARWRLNYLLSRHPFEN